MRPDLTLIAQLQRYMAFYVDVGIPWTNNHMEQRIGRFKSRAQRAKGYKTTAGLSAETQLPIGSGH